MKIPCKVWPTDGNILNAHPAFPNEKFDWMPIIDIRLVHKHCPPTKRIEAIVDSGSPACMFHASVCQAMGIKLEDGISVPLGGVVAKGQGGKEAPMYFHKVKVIIGLDQFQTMAGFSWGMAVFGLLGRRGFLENFVTTFDSSDYPPFLDIQKIHRA